MDHQLIIILDFGGQYNQLIARRVRECGVYCEVKPYHTPLTELAARKPIGFIFTGGPNSVYETSAPHVDPALFELGVPVLGICYGCQLMAQTLGGLVTAAQDRARAEGLADAPLVLAGFSFGSFVQSRVASTLAASGAPAPRLIFIGAAVSRFAVDPVPPDTLVIHGETDDVVPLSAVFEWARPLDLPVVVIPGADHFFHRKLPLLKRIVMAAFGNHD